MLKKLKNAFGSTREDKFDENDKTVITTRISAMYIAHPQMLDRVLQEMPGMGRFELKKQGAEYYIKSRSQLSVPDILAAVGQQPYPGGRLKR
ncbi:hypothetical protein EKO27_g6514 [Xylaria grammica]|uniref:Uncharacterized protein n=1 Tax=Xylaria grammica TaxID=363999 RepID=A0A439D2C3_9PEZI|nr:hypothetical protein EKO27_g6514 [Xylaria grammica]